MELTKEEVSAIADRLDDIIGEWYKLKATHYTLNSEDRNGMIHVMNSLEVDQQ